MLAAWNANAQEGNVLSATGKVVRLIVLSFIVVIPAAALGEDIFPITGTYSENEACMTKGVEAGGGRVKITPDAIDSNFGLCQIANKQRDGKKITAQIMCKDTNGGILMSGVTFTLRDDKAIDFVDQYQTYSAVLYKCRD
jgi:hypothetical protein